MKTFTFDSTGKLYYNNEDLFKQHKSFYTGFLSKPRKIIEKKQIPNNEYVYMYNEKNGTWKITDASYKKAKLFISKEWFDNTISIKKQNNEEIKNKIIENLPPLLELEDNEKFRDVNDKIINIEVRGQKDRKNIYFKVKDVSVGFDIPNLNSNLNHLSSNYEENIHYKNFYSTSLDNIQLGLNRFSMYLTYKGLLRVLFVSRSKNVERFQDWAEEKLFTIQIGEQEEKENLSFDLLGINMKTFKNVFNKHANVFPCIYLINLGTVKELRNKMNISTRSSDDKSIDYEDDAGVYKYGYSADFEDRLNKHKSHYKKLLNINNIKISLFNIIDPIYLSQAETILDNLFSALNKTIKYENETELVLLNSKDNKFIRQQYELIGTKYAGHSKGLQEEILKLKNEVKLKEQIHKNEIERYQHIIELKDKELLLKDKELEIINLKLQLAKK